VICFNGFPDDSTQGKQVELGKKDLQTLICYSNLHCDSTVKEHLICLLEKPNATLSIHEKCRKNFTDSRRLNVTEDSTAGPSSPKKVKLRSNVEVFNWIKDSFFCTKSTETDSHNSLSFAQNQQKLILITLRGQALYIQYVKKSFRKKVLKKCEERNDVWSVEVN